MKVRMVLPALESVLTGFGHHPAGSLVEAKPRHTDSLSGVTTYAD
jgi:hypothetical protein